MIANVMALSKLWTDFFSATGIVALSGILGYFSREIILALNAL